MSEAIYKKPWPGIVAFTMAFLSQWLGHSTYTVIEQSFGHYHYWVAFALGAVGFWVVWQGLDKAETAAKYGDEQVHIWRRSYDIPPPSLDADDERHPANDARYSGIADLPATESLATTLLRVEPCWSDAIAPALRAGNDVLVAAHGNSLRALVKMLDGISDEEITGFNIPTGVPLAYELDDALKPVSSEFLGDPEAIAKAAAAVAAQGKAK